MSNNDSLIFKIASEPWEFDQIHELNYRTFVDEIPQHQQNEEQKLVDKFHQENTYVICVRNKEVLGMIALRDKRPLSLDEKLEKVNKTDKDIWGKLVEASYLESVERQKLEASKAAINRQKDKLISKAEAAMRLNVRQEESRVRLWALVLPPLPAVLIGLFVFATQMRRESAGTPLTRSMRQR